MLNLTADSFLTYLWLLTPDSNVIPADSFPLSRLSFLFFSRIKSTKLVNNTQNSWAVFSFIFILFLALLLYILGLQTPHQPVTPKLQSEPTWFKSMSAVAWPLWLSFSDALLTRWRLAPTAENIDCNRKSGAALPRNVSSCLAVMTVYWLPPNVLRRLNSLPRNISSSLAVVSSCLSSSYLSSSLAVAWPFFDLVSLINHWSIFYKITGNTLEYCIRSCLNKPIQKSESKVQYIMKGLRVR